MKGATDPGRTFGGAVYEPSLDRARLALQVERIRSYMLGVEWRTLREIKSALEDRYAPAMFPESSISAQLRNLKKTPYFYGLAKRRRVGAHGIGAGLWEYRLLPPSQIGLFVEKKHERSEAVHVVDDGVPDDGSGREEFFRVARRIASMASVNSERKKGAFVDG